MIKISVIIPAYNCGHLVLDAVYSVLQQNYQEGEIIVIDDGSTDDTRKILAPFVQKNIIRYFYQKNIGLPGARNAGILQAQGEYVLCLDADDEISEDCLNIISALVMKKEVNWLVSDLMRIDENGSIYQKAVFPSGENWVVDTMAENPRFHAFFFRKKMLLRLGLFDSKQKYYEDWELYLRFFENKVPFEYIPQPLYIYKIRKGSITKDKNLDRKLFYMEKIYRKHYKILVRQDTLARKLYAKRYYQLGKDYFKNGNVSKGFFSLWEAFVTDPGFMCLSFLRKKWVVKNKRKYILETKHEVE